MEILGKARASGGGVQAKATGVFSKTSGGKSDGGGGGGGGGAKAISSEEVSYLANRVAYLDEALKKAGGGIDALKSQIGAKTSAQGYAQTAKKFQNAVTKSTLRMTESAFRFQYALITLLLLFILHQVTLALTCTPITHTRALEQCFQSLETSSSLLRAQIFEVRELTPWCPRSYLCGSTKTPTLLLSVPHSCLRASRLRGTCRASCTMEAWIS